MKQLRTLQQENARLKKLLAERDLEIEVMRRKSPQKSGERAGAARTDQGVRRSRHQCPAGGGGPGLNGAWYNSRLFTKTPRAGAVAPRMSWPI